MLNVNCGISDEDLGYFELRFRRATVFWKRALALLHQLHNQDYLGKRTGTRKKFMEEVLPLAVLARNLECPGRVVHCKYTGRSHGADGTLRLSGSRQLGDPSRIDVEITTAEPNKAHLHREALRIHGSAFVGPNIWQSGNDNKGNKKIVSSPCASDPETDHLQNVELITRAIVNKSKNKSNVNNHEKMLLLVDFHPDNIPNDDEWYSLIVATREIAHESGFQSVYISYFERARTYRLFGKLY